MALNKTNRSRTSKAFISIVIVLGSLAVSVVANMFVTMLMRQLGLEHSQTHVVVNWAVTGAALTFAAFIVWYAWSDASPERLAEIDAAKRRARETGARRGTPLFDDARERDRQAMAAVLAESSEDDGQND